MQIKKKKISKPAAKKKVKKTASPLRAKKVNKKNGKPKDASKDFIFDSTVGKTDALFVSDPETGMPVTSATPAPKEIDPAINEALKEFDDLQKTPVETRPATTQNTQKIPDSINADVKPKIPFWKKFLPKKWFS